MVSTQPKRAKVLIVDDVLVNVKYLLEALKHDYDVTYALNGEDALRLSQQQHRIWCCWM